MERGVEEALAGAFESKRQTKTRKKRQNSYSAKKKSGLESKPAGKN